MDRDHAIAPPPDIDAPLPLMGMLIVLNAVFAIGMGVGAFAYWVLT